MLRSLKGTENLFFVNQLFKDDNVLHEHLLIFSYLRYLYVHGLTGWQLSSATKSMAKRRILKDDKSIQTSNDFKRA